MLANDLIAQIAKEMNDPGYDWWTQSDWADYIDDAGKNIALFKPNAYLVQGTYQLKAGLFQSLPDGSDSYKNPDGDTLSAAVQPYSFLRNMGTDGKTIGDPIDTIDQLVMDSLKPGWATEDASSVVKCVVIDDDNNNIDEEIRL